MILRLFHQILVNNGVTAVKEWYLLHIATSVNNVHLVGEKGFLHFRGMDYNYFFSEAERSDFSASSKISDTQAVQ